MKNEHPQFMELEKRFAEIQPKKFAYFPQWHSSKGIDVDTFELKEAIETMGF